MLAVHVVAAVRELEGVTDVHHVHASSLTSGRNVFSNHVCVREWQAGERVLREVNDLLRDRFKVYFSTTQLEGKRVICRCRSA